MRTKILPLLIFIIASVCFISAQADRAGYVGPQPTVTLDPVAGIAIALTNISRSVKQLNERLKSFVDKFEKVGGMTLTEKQQRFLLGLEILVRSEQRVATLQKSHTELMEKHIQVKSRLTQVDLDLRPQNIERSTQLVGSTQTVEIRENRREKLLAEQRSLTQLVQQTERNVAETEAALQEAQTHVNRLRRSLLPQIGREIEQSTIRRKTFRQTGATGSDHYYCDLF